MKRILVLLPLFLLGLNLFGQVGIFPGEERPEDVLNKRSVAAGPNNWGEDLLLPDALLDRVKAECKYKVLVKVFDTAQGYNHNDLNGATVTGTNYCNPAGSAVDVQGHSTHVAGIIGSKYVGLTRGLVEKGLLKIKPVKVLGDTGSGSFDWITNAIKGEDVENKALLTAATPTFVICNMSLGGGTGKIAATEAALKASRDLGVLYCVAAGNTGSLGVTYPGNSEYVTAVGSITQQLTRSSFSTFGPEVWVGMPGSAIYSTYLNQTYASLSGTSMATPMEVGVEAIALSKWGPAVATQAKMKAYIAWVSTDITPTGKDNETGYGYQLVKNILDKNPANMPGTPTPPNPPTDTTPTPNPPIHELRNLQFKLDGSYQIVWGINGQAEGVKKSKTNKNFKVSNGDAQGFEKLTVTSLEIQVVGSKLFAADEYALVNKNVSNFFINRGLGLAPGSDYADATYWTAYFLDLILKTENKYDIEVVRIEAKDVKGNTVVYNKDALKSFK